MATPEIGPEGGGQVELMRAPVSTTTRRSGRGPRGHRTGRAVLAMIVGASLLLAPGSVPASRAGVGPTCNPRPGILQIVGYELIITARPGEANDLEVALAGGTYTPPETGVPLTTQVYAITERGAPGYIPEVFCASDENASCIADDAGVIWCAAILTDIVIDVGDLDDVVSLVGVPAPAFVLGGGGNDTIVGGNGPDRIVGGAAGDFIAGSGGDDTIDGGPGWDTLDGGSGNDTISGGSWDAFSTSGNDTIRGGPGSDLLDGGSGSLTDPDDDLLDYSDATVPLDIDLAASNVVVGTDLDTFVGFESLAGGSGPDHLVGDSSANRIYGGDGADTIDGRGGANEIHGEGGNDRIEGGAGDETLDGGPGDDRIFDSWEDLLFDGGSDDTLVGGEGNDRLVAGTGDNVLSGEAGNDWLVSGCSAVDHQSGSTPVEHNSLLGGTGSDTLTNPADAVCEVPGFGGQAHGQTRDDLDGGIKLTGDVDVADYCAGDDPRSDALPDGYRPLAARDWTTCGRHRDQTISLSWAGVPSEGDEIRNIDAVIGGAGNDRVELSNGYVNGSTGADTIDAAVANGGPGGVVDQGDVLNGSIYRSRTADYSLRADPLALTLDGIANDGAPGEGDNILTDDVLGGAGDDYLEGDGASNQLDGGDGDDTIKGGGDRDWVLGGPGDDTLDGGPGQDVLDGEDGDDVLLSRDGEVEAAPWSGVWCGDGNDVARVDRQDYVNPFTCERQIVGVTQVVGTGDTVTSDVEGDGADLAHPVEVTAQASANGTAEITEYPSTGQNPSGFVLLGVRYDIRLPAGTAQAPNVLTFRVDASQVPAGQDEYSIFLYRNGVLVPVCDPSPPRVATTAAPDPCEASRTVLADGDVEIVILTSHASEWDFAVDVEAPTITVDVPGAQPYLLHQSVLAGYTCTDAGSGVATCAGPVADGAAIDTGSVGAKTFTVAAWDRVGNRSTLDVTYHVIYDFRGFYSPLDNPGHIEGLLNLVKAGASVPVKFSLTGYQGLGIMATDYPASSGMTCQSSAPTDPLEETAVPGKAALSYEAATDTYTYAWKTDRSWAGTCRKLIVRLIDGTDHTVLFKFNP